MKFESYIPTELLRPYIKEYRIVESNDDRVNRVLPEMAQVIAFRVRGQVNYLSTDSKEKLPNLVLTGLKTSVRLINYTPHSANILVIFKAAGAAAFFREPMHYFFEETVSLENFIPQKEITNLEEQLGLAKDTHSRITLIERFLLSRLHNRMSDKLIMAAIQKIHQTTGLYRIKDLAASLYISQDAFEKRFRKLVGATPKQFSSIVRMKNLIVEKQKKRSLTEIAIEAGFFDQPHFNKDFKLFTGLTPTDFFKSGPLW